MTGEGSNQSLAVDPRPVGHRAGWAVVITSLALFMATVSVFTWARSWVMMGFSCGA